LWSNGAPTQTITVSPTTNTAYYVTVVDANGCTASDFVIVNTLPTQTAQFTHTVSGSTAVFSNQSSSAYTYSWSFGDNTTSNAVNPSHTYAQNGTYTVTLTVTGPCGTSTFTQVVTITQVGLEEHQTLNNMSLYPNPNDGAFTISFEMTQEADVQIQVLDVAGRIVWSDQPGALMVYNKQVALNTEASGMYVVRIITPSHVNHLKVNVVK
jgi:PKD repeat protein